MNGARRSFQLVASAAVARKLHQSWWLKGDHSVFVCSPLALGSHVHRKAKALFDLSVLCFIYCFVLKCLRFEK